MIAGGDVPAGALPVVAVGAGSMGRAWLRVLADSPEVVLTGVVDLDLDAARAAAAELGAPDLPTGADAVALAGSTGAEAVVDVTVPVAHHPVTTACLVAGLPVLGEKPVAATLPEALSLAAASEVTGRLFMVSQSRRWNPMLARLRSHVGRLGAVGTLACDFFKAPRFGGFRDAMAHPLLVDMAIHQFDMARYLLADDPVAVSCESWNPPWSWYAGDASATAVFTFAGGTRFVFDGSWCAPGEETSWEGRWHVSAEHGTATWTGDDDPVASDGVPAATVSERTGIAASLELFCDALRTGTPPEGGEVHENVLSLAMVEAAVGSAATGRRVLLDDVLERAREQAVAAEDRDDVRAALRSWPSVREALVGPR